MDMTMPEYKEYINHLLQQVHDPRETVVESPFDLIGQRSAYEVQFSLDNGRYVCYAYNTMNEVEEEVRRYGVDKLIHIRENH